MRLLLLILFTLFGIVLYGQHYSNFLPKNIIEISLSGNWVTDSIYCFRKNDNTNQMENDFRVYNQEFDDNGNLILELTQTYSNDVWVNFVMKKSSFDSSNRLLETTTESYDIERRGWLYSNKSLFKYNTNGYLLELEYQEYDGSNWNRVFRNQYSYLNNEDPIEFSQQVFESGFWKNNFKVYYSYNGSGQITSSLFTQWDSAMNDWRKVNQTFESYDNQNRLSQSIREIWIPQEARWQLSSRESRNYDIQAEISVEERWQEFDSTWVPERDMEVLFNENNNEINRIERVFENNTFENFFKSENEYDDYFNLKFNYNYLYINGMWDLISRCSYFQTQKTSSSKEVVLREKLNCKFPNPINNLSSISCENFEDELVISLMNSTGQVLMRKEYAEDFFISGTFPDGFYFLTIYSKDLSKIFTEKIIWTN